MKTIINTLLASALATLAFPAYVIAHQSGCHRWHSCPSDTGSYVCGDLGYDTYCGYEEPDYESEGHDKGLDYASDDSAVIIQRANGDGDNDGYEDGRNGSVEDNSPNASLSCDKSFTFQGFAPDEYQDAYKEAYKESCTERYDDAYITAYTAGYQRGKDEYSAAKEQENDNPELADNNMDSSDGGEWFWTALFGGGAIWYGATSMSNSRKRRHH